VGVLCVMVRRLALVALSLAVLAVLTPLLVILAARAGLEPTHWSGVRLGDVRLPPDRIRAEPMPEPAAVLLDRARRQDEADAGDLAPSWWDGGAGQVVLGAVTDRGERLRRTLVQGQAPPYRVERRAHSTRELTDAMDAATELDVSWTGVDAEGNRVRVGARSLDHALFTTAADRFGDVVVVLEPFAPETYLDQPPADPPSWWSRAHPPGTWFALTTGFPWYLGAAALIVAAAWVAPRLARRRRHPEVAAPA